MNASLSIRGRAGFTLVEVLAALGLCAFLAVAVASAVSFAARAERAAARHGEASLLAQSLYAALRLRPADLPAAPAGWRVEADTDIVKISDELMQEWNRLAVRADGDDIPPFVLRILGTAP